MKIENSEKKAQSSIIYQAVQISNYQRNFMANKKRFDIPQAPLILRAINHFHIKLFVCEFLFFFLSFFQRNKTFYITNLKSIKYWNVVEKFSEIIIFTIPFQYNVKVSLKISLEIEINLDITSKTKLQFYYY